MNAEYRLPPVEECKFGNCVTHFPQFAHVTKEDIVSSCTTVISQANQPDSYFVCAYSRYGNVRSTADTCIRAREATERGDLISACTILQEFINAEHTAGRSCFVDGGFYINLRRDGVLRYVPCCR